MRRVAGFTLIELLLVLVIIGVVTALAVPEYVRSMRGNRLRTATRTVVAAGRYARSMAVLHQRAMTVSFDLDRGLIVIDAATRSRPAGEAPAEASEWPVQAAGQAAAAEAEPLPQGGPGMEVRLEQALELVSIEQVRIQGRNLTVREGVVDVVYQTHGRCDPHEVRISERDGGVMIINVDALASAAVRREDAF